MIPTGIVKHRLYVHRQQQQQQRTTENGIVQARCNDIVMTLHFWSSGIFFCLGAV